MTFIPVFQYKFTTDGISGLAVTSTPVWINGGSTNFIVSGSAIRCTLANSITTGPTIGVGNSTSTNDILSPVAILALNSAGKTFNFQMIGMSAVVPPGGTVYANTLQAAAGISQTISVDITGYWISS